MTAYTQSLTEDELLNTLSQLESRQKTLDVAERYQLGIAALYLWDRYMPAMPGDARYATIQRCSRLASEHLPAAYRLKPESIVAFHLWEMYLMQANPSKAVEVMEDQLRRVGGQAVYERYLQAKKRKWTGVPSLPVPSLQPDRLWLFSRVVYRLYCTFGIEWGAEVPVFRRGTGVVTGTRLVKGVIDQAGRDYMKDWYDRIQKALQRSRELSENSREVQN